MVLRTKLRVLTLMRNITEVVIALLCAFALAGCGGFAEWLVVRLFYREAVLARAQVHKDLKYRVGSSADPHKHRLDFYVPEGSGWPVLIFVHGGGWRSGDKALEFGATDPYGNIGRFYATRGIGVALVNYRLQPAVSWREQVVDVAQALAWVYGHAQDYGANKRAIFVSGHSSGAQLVTRAVLDHKVLRELRLPPHVPCGVIAVSGAPFDISDSRTYELGTNPVRYEKPFRVGEDGERWKYEASAVNFVTSSAPPFLLLHGGWEPKGLKRQNQVMHEALKAAGVPSQLVVTPWDGHFLIVASVSHPDKMASAAILEFIRLTQCR
ncbi:MAG TPA: alpha/beta hydrolase [Candidatus Binatia bacterium]